MAAIDYYADKVLKNGLADYYDEPKLLSCLPITAFPTSILEAMACSTPILATQFGAIPDVSVDEGIGFLLESTAPERIAQQITMISIYKEREKVADNAGGLLDKSSRELLRQTDMRKYLNKIFWACSEMLFSLKSWFIFVRLTHSCGCRHSAGRGRKNGC